MIARNLHAVRHYKISLPSLCACVCVHMCVCVCAQIGIDQVNCLFGDVKWQFMMAFVLPSVC